VWHAGVRSYVVIVPNVAAITKVVERIYQFI